MAVEEGGEKASVAVGGLFSPPHPREHQWQAWVDAHVPGACVLNLYGPCFHETFYILHTLAGEIGGKCGCTFRVLNREVLAKEPIRPHSVLRPTPPRPAPRAAR
jgi:hypothetical protein